MAWNTVVAGGGFAGLYAVPALERRLPRHSAKISIVSGVELPPLLAAAAGNGWRRAEPRHVTVPIREELEDAPLLIGRVADRDRFATTSSTGRAPGTNSR